MGHSQMALAHSPPASFSSLQGLGMCPLWTPPLGREPSVCLDTPGGRVPVSPRPQE